MDIEEKKRIIEEMKEKEPEMYEYFVEVGKAFGKSREIKWEEK